MDWIIWQCTSGAHRDSRDFLFSRGVRLSFGGRPELMQPLIFLAAFSAGRSPDTQKLKIRLFEYEGGDC
jgi:hypothetical protein